MGKRSRKRGGSPTPREDRPAPARAGGGAATRQKAYRASLDEAPQPVWAPFPLTEIAIFIGLVLTIIGFVGSAGTTLVAGIGLVALASAELAAREHFAGYRSHSALLAAIVGVLVAVGLGFAGVPQAVVLPIGLAILLGGFLLLRDVFKRRSGVGFRV